MDEELSSNLSLEDILINVSYVNDQIIEQLCS